MNKLIKLLDQLRYGKKIVFANDAVKKEYHIDKLEISYSIAGSTRYITLNKIIINDKGHGYGSMFMTDLCSWCDINDKILCLTPDDSFGTTKPKLIKFYKRFGFVENKGRNSDFNIKEAFYRLPE